MRRQLYNSTGAAPETENIITRHVPTRRYRPRENRGVTELLGRPRAQLWALGHAGQCLRVTASGPGLAGRY